MRHKIDFGLAFLICIFIIFSSKVWSIIGNYPEAFRYGSILYQIIDVFLYVLGNLSIGVAGAIIFYYVQQLLEKKKNFELYTELRRILLFMFYKHLEVLAEIEDFKEIKQRDNRFLGYDYHDIPVFERIYSRIDTVEEKEIFNNKLANHFINMSTQELEKFSNSFQIEIDELTANEDARYFKESKDLISTICSSYEENFSIIMGIYVDEKNKSGSAADYLAADDVVPDYIDFLDSLIALYTEVKIFIESIEKKKIMEFMRMLD